MSPLSDLRRHLRQRFPRVSGDEPLLPVTLTVDGPFSPRERG